jgi:hypothetical protein
MPYDPHTRTRLAPTDALLPAGELPLDLTDGRAVSSWVAETGSGIGRMKVIRVFVAGAAGCWGGGWLPQLVARGHQVTVTTTSAAELDLLARLGGDGRAGRGVGR